MVNMVRFGLAVEFFYFLEVQVDMFRYFLVFIMFLFFCGPLFAVSEEAVDVGGKSLLVLFVVEGGPIVWYILIPVSVLTMFVVSVLCVSLKRSRLLAEGAAGEIVLAARRGNISGLEGREDIVSKVVWRVITKSKNIGADRKYMHELAKEALHEQALILLRKVEWCGIIGNVAPMVGLFGTVYGMIQAFDVLGAAGGQPRPDQLAAKISIALVTTFWGLLIAIPSLVVHGVFRSRIESVIGEAGVEVETVIGELFRGKTAGEKIEK